MGALPNSMRFAFAINASLLIGRDLFIDVCNARLVTEFTLGDRVPSSYVILSPSYFAIKRHRRTWDEDFRLFLELKNYLDIDTASAWNHTPTLMRGASTPERISEQDDLNFDDRKIFLSTIDSRSKFYAQVRGYVNVVQLRS